MDAVNQFFVWTASFMGYWIGFGLANIAQEELNSGEFTFILLERILFTATAAPLAVLAYLQGAWTILAATVIGYLALLFLTIRYQELIRYGYMFLILFATLNAPLYFLLTAVAMFLYGFPSGTLSYMKKYFI